MSNAVRPIPEGYHSITPQITCRDAAAAIDFYKNVLGATELMRMASPDGKVMHAELQIGDSRLTVNDEFPGMAAAPAPAAVMYGLPLLSLLAANAPPPAATVSVMMRPVPAHPASSAGMISSESDVFVFIVWKAPMLPWPFGGRG